MRSGVLWMLCVGFGLAQDPKPNPPGEEARAKAEKEIREVFKNEYAQKTPAGQRTLARLLLKQGTETRDDQTAQFVLFRESADLAGRSGDLETLLSALEALCSGFKVDVVDIRMSALLKAETALSAAGDHQRLAEALIALSRDALALEQFDSASKASLSCVAAARKSKDLALTTRAEAAAKAVEEARTAGEKARSAEQTLKTTPGDPSAHQLRGEYLCFIRGEWEQGLPHLGSGTDATLRALANRERSNPADPAAGIEIADGWWDLSIAEKSPLRKLGIRNHARSLYERALPAVTGLLRKKLEERLAEGSLGHGPLDSRQKATREGLVAWWKCDEGQGNVITDSSGAGRVGTLFNMLWASGRKGSALRFNGSSSYVSCSAANLPATQAPQTVSWWHFITASGGGNVIVISNAEAPAAVQIGVDKEKVSMWKLGGEPLLAAPYTKISAWTHCAYTYDGKTHLLYINGRLEARCEIPPQMGTPTRCEFGRWWGPVGSGYYNGLLSDIRIYNRALSASEIAVLAAGGD